MGGYIIPSPIPHRVSLTYKNCSLCAMMLITFVYSTDGIVSARQFAYCQIPVHCGLGGRRVSEQGEHTDIVALLMPKSECDFGVAVYFFAWYNNMFLIKKFD